MGFFSKLFGKNKDAAPVEVPVEAPVEAPAEAPVETPAETPVEVPVEAPVETPVETPVEVPVEAPVEAPAETPVETPAEVPAEAEASAPAPAAEKKPTAKTKKPKTTPAPSFADATDDEQLQKQLTRYFERLAAAYPDKKVVRINTDQKKLAERGAALRKELGMTDDIDGFFALGGFTYERLSGGRPRTVSLDEDALKKRIKKVFPKGVPTIAMLRECDPRLYLDLRSVCRAKGVSQTAWLNENGLLQSTKG